MDIERVVAVLATATLAGFILGWPARRRPGGIRVHFMVAFGAALFCATGLRVAIPANLDVLRVVQGIISGIGFVGAATVIKARGHIYGVTNATSIWIAAAIGCEIALGSLPLALGLSLFVAAATEGIAVLERKVFRRRHVVIEGAKDEPPP